MSNDELIFINYLTMTQRFLYSFIYDKDEEIDTQSMEEFEHETKIIQEAINSVSREEKIDICLSTMSEPSYKVNSILDAYDTALRAFKTIGDDFSCAYLEQNKADIIEEAIDELDIESYMILFALSLKMHSLTKEEKDRAVDVLHEVSNQSKATKLCLNSKTVEKIDMLFDRIYTEGRNIEIEFEHGF